MLSKLTGRRPATMPYSPTACVTTPRRTLRALLRGASCNPRGVSLAWLVANAHNVAMVFGMVLRRRLLELEDILFLMKLMKSWLY